MTDHADTHGAEDDPRNESILIWVDGRLLPRAEATVSVCGWGFMMGDGVWEGLRLHDGTWARLDEHLDRPDIELDEVSLDRIADWAQPYIAASPAGPPRGIEITQPAAGTPSRHSAGARAREQARADAAVNGPDLASRLAICGAA